MDQIWTDVENNWQPTLATGAVLGGLGATPGLIKSAAYAAPGWVWDGIGNIWNLGAEVVGEGAETAGQVGGALKIGEP